MKDIKPLKPYQDPLFYLGGVFGLSSLLSAYNVFFGGMGSTTAIPSLIVAGASGIYLKKFLSSRCPKCKRINSKEHRGELEELDKEWRKFWYCNRIFIYPDGHEEEDTKTKKFRLRSANFVTKYFVCKNCGYGEEKDWRSKKKFVGWADTFDPPIPQKIRVDKDGYVLKKENKVKKDE